MAQILIALGLLQLNIMYADMLPSFGFEPFLVFRSHFLRLYLFFRLCDPLTYFQKFIDYNITRRKEYRADRFSVDLGYANSLKDAVIKIHLNNKGNLNPDWLYSIFKFSHPAFTERLDAIDKQVIKLTAESELQKAYQKYSEMFKEKFVKRHGELLFQKEMGL